MRDWITKKISDENHEKEKMIGADHPVGLSVWGGRGQGSVGRSEWGFEWGSKGLIGASGGGA